MKNVSWVTPCPNLTWPSVYAVWDEHKELWVYGVCVSWVSCDPSLSHPTPGGLVPSDRSVAAERVLGLAGRWGWPPSGSRDCGHPTLTFACKECQASLSNHVWNVACHLGYFCFLSLSGCCSTVWHMGSFFLFPHLTPLSSIYPLSLSLWSLWVELLSSLAAFHW